MKKALFILSVLLTPFVLHAQSVDILWEGQGYVPPFYEGGAPWAKEGRIRFLAIPQGLGNPQNLFFKWSRNGTVLGNTNGLGVTTLNLSDSIFSKPQTISVEIVGGDETTLAQTSVTVTPRAPEVLIYEKNPLYGVMFNREAGRGYVSSKEELVFEAFPLFFHTLSMNAPQLSYSWRSASGEDSREPMVTYRVPEGAAGNASVSITISNAETLMQKVSKGFLIQFEQ